MRTILFVLAAAASTLGAGLAGAQNASDPGGVIEAKSGWNAMDCQGDCIAGQKRRSWLALVPGPAGWTLMPARLKFPVNDADDLGSNVKDAEFYLSHPALVPGHASTPDMRFKGQRRSLGPDSQPLRLDFHGRHYEITMDGSAVTLHEGARKSVLGDVDVQRNEHSDITLLWAGDLDGDGQLDLIIQSAGEKSAATCLLLSSAKKKPDELLSVVGCEDFSG
jgi:hypothetical protein